MRPKIHLTFLFILLGYFCPRLMSQNIIDIQDVKYIDETTIDSVRFIQDFKKTAIYNEYTFEKEELMRETTPFNIDTLLAAFRGMKPVSDIQPMTIEAWNKFFDSYCVVLESDSNKITLLARPNKQEIVTSTYYKNLLGKKTGTLTNGFVYDAENTFSEKYGFFYFELNYNKYVIALADKDLTELYGLIIPFNESLSFIGSRVKYSSVLPREKDNLVTHFIDKKAKPRKKTRADFPLPEPNLIAEKLDEEKPKKVINADGKSSPSDTEEIIADTGNSSTEKAQAEAPAEKPKPKAKQFKIDENGELVEDKPKKVELNAFDFKSRFVKPGDKEKTAEPKEAEVKVADEPKKIESETKKAEPEAIIPVKTEDTTEEKAVEEPTKIESETKKAEPVAIPVKIIDKIDVEEAEKLKKIETEEDLANLESHFVLMDSKLINLIANNIKFKDGYVFEKKEPIDYIAAEHRRFYIFFEPIGDKYPEEVKLEYRTSTSSHSKYQEGRRRIPSTSTMPFL